MKSVWVDGLVRVVREVEVVVSGRGFGVVGKKEVCGGSWWRVEGVMEEWGVGLM